MQKLNCWEFKKCGREVGGAKVKEMGVCPAARGAEVAGVNGGVATGRICWMVAGTYCGGEVQGTFAEKRLSCMSCEFFALVQREEGRAFKLTLHGEELPARKR